MKKVLSVVAVIGMLLLVFCVGRTQVINQEKEVTVEGVTEEVVEAEEVHILTDEELSLLYTCKQDERKTSDEIVELSIEDANLLMKLGASESGDCGSDAQFLTMLVVMNRLKDKRFPDSIKDIIYQDSQFAVIDNGKFDKTEPNVDSHIALAWIEMGMDDSQGAIYFEASTNSSNSWHCQNKEFLYEAYGQKYYK